MAIEHKPAEQPAAKHRDVRFDLQHEDRSNHKGTPSTPKDDGRSPLRSVTPTGQSTLRARTGFTSRMSRMSSQTSAISEATDLEELDSGLEKAPWCWNCGFLCSGSGCYYCLYVLVFLGFLIFFPLFLKWMITSPMPQEYWYAEFERKGFKFPQLVDWTFVRTDLGKAHKIHMSDIPKTLGACNYSCSTRGGFLRPSSEMNFQVDVQLEAGNLEHNAYPLLLASNDFDKWWVAADRRHSYPKSYFESHTADKGSTYRHVTDSCTRPPELLPENNRYSHSPTYVLTCITWTDKSALRLRQSKTLDGKKIGELCDAVGGVCGWPCGTNPQAVDLAGCSSQGQLVVNKELGEIAGKSIAGAKFSGDVSVRACLGSPGSKECITSSEPMFEWPCHKCRLANHTPNQALEYQSLPRMEVLLRNASVDKDLMHSMDPQAFFFTSPIAADGQGPAGMEDVWEKLYDHEVFPGPISVEELEAKLDEEGDEVHSSHITTTSPSPHLDMSRNTMRFAERNKVTIEPSWCFGRRGPMYLVACAVNSSTYGDDNFQFKPGQAVAGPPFNDRCLAVTGRCAYACQEHQFPMRHCSASGVIDHDELVKFTESKKNRTLSVYAFLVTLLVGFAVKILAYLPGLFVPYKSAKFYKPEMTEQLKYIAVCAPSGGESKACVVRNLVGALSSLPFDCECPFHVIFADEGHRHAHKIMFRVYVKVMACVPSVRMTNYNARKLKQGQKQENLKAFTHAWVDATKNLLLEDCNVDKLMQKIKNLEAEDKPANASTIGKLNGIIDALCGMTALKMMQDRKGWPQAEASPEVAELELSIMQLRTELTIGETKYDGTGTNRGGHRDNPKSVNFDDCEAFGWLGENKHSLYTLHYVARAKPDEDERTIAVQHIARGTWCYKVPKPETGCQPEGSWLDLRQELTEFGDDVRDPRYYFVPIRTSRGKAGGLNFAENYLFDFHRRKYERDVSPDEFYKHGLFSIADARHQYQPDFFLETIPYFFRTETELNPRVAFTQCPQFFPAMPDEADYLDTNNSSFFRMGCMLRNCCGGVSSCGTNGTWLIRDRRAGKHGSASMWELEEARQMEQGFTQIVERRFFHESCKVEDTASSLERVVKGKYSQYITMRLSYGMAKDPTDFLAAIQRWAEGGVVLALQTFFGSEQGVYMVWMALLLFLLFIVSTFSMTFSYGTDAAMGSFFVALIGDDLFSQHLRGRSLVMAQWFAEAFDQAEQSVEDYQEMFYQTMLWMIFLVMAIFVLWFVTLISHYIHYFLGLHRTRFPTNLAQWARLLITVDNLTYFLWFWTSFFWIGFNYYGVFSVKDYNFDPMGMSLFMWILQVLSWSMLLSASARYLRSESRNANEVFALTLTNIWRTTQMFYITAPLTLFSIIMGFSDFLRNRMFGQDISYWVGGDRGKLSKLMVQYWTLLLVLGMIFTWFAYNLGWLPDKQNAFASVVIVTVIGLDVMHPCAFLWLGTQPEKLPAREEVKAEGLGGMLQERCKRFCQLLFCGAFYRNFVRSILFNSTCTGFIKWIAPLQHVILPILTLFLPELGINQVFLLVTAVK